MPELNHTIESEIISLFSAYSGNKDDLLLHEFSMLTGMEAQDFHHNTMIMINLMVSALEIQA